MSQVSIARRYAKALLSLGTDDGQFEKYADEIQAVGAVFHVSVELQDLWLNPSTPRELRMRGVETLSFALKLSGTVQNLVRLLVERHRAADLPMLSRVYRDLVDERLGRVRASLSTPVAVSEAFIAQATAALKTATQKNITLEAKVDPSLLGGAVAQVGSTLYDGSLRTALQQLRTELENTRIHT